MPGFLIFEEFGLDPDMPGAGLAKAALGMVPMSWMLHGLGGEYNVDVDPIAEINATMQGGGAIGNTIDKANASADAAAEGDAGGAVSNALGIVGQFWEAYKGWIPVASVSQNIPGAAEMDDHDVRSATAEAVASLTGSDVAAMTGRMISSSQSNGTNGPLSNDQLRALGTAELSHRGKRKAISGMNSGEGVNKLSVECHLDASLPKLIGAALDSDGGKEFSVADVHLCTTASVDLRALTFGSDNPAAQVIQALIGFAMFNVVPYLTINMRDVKITSLSYNLAGDADGTVPTITVELKFKKVTWCYHVINGSNMNLFNVSYEYDVTKRKKPVSFSLGSMINPFA